MHVYTLRENIQEKYHQRYKNTCYMQTVDKEKEKEKEKKRYKCYFLWVDDEGNKTSTLISDFR